jgi:DNA-binding LytR/AlgR family response regulator
MTDRPDHAPTAIIADDEPRLAEYLESRLRALWPELAIAGIAANGPEALALVHDEAPDIAFLDIRMPGLTGLEVAQRAGHETHLVFVTAYDQYAVKAALAVLARLTGAREPGAPERLAWVRALVGEQVRLISVDDVCYFQSNDKYTSVFTADTAALIRTPLKELGDQLDPARFWQVHRGTIVNLAHVKATARDFSGRISLALRTRPERIAVSRAYAHRFKQM